MNGRAKLGDIKNTDNNNKKGKTPSELGEYSKRREFRFQTKTEKANVQKVVSSAKRVLNTRKEQMIKSLRGETHELAQKRRTLKSEQSEIWAKLKGPSFFLFSPSFSCACFSAPPCLQSIQIKSVL